jgi:ketosteroid isomerase-like protein
MLCLLLWALSVPGSLNERKSAETSASAVVQHFVDAANRHDLDAMMATVAPDAVFSVLPSGEILGSSRDAIREYYGRLLARVNPGFVAKIARRIEEGSFSSTIRSFTKRARGRPFAPQSGSTGSETV